MRSDFFPRLSEFSTLLTLAEGTGSYHLPPPVPVELGQMIRRPAQVAGLRFDVHPETKQSLDEALRDAASADPLILPLLEFALEELYKRQQDRGDGLLRWEDYQAFREIEGVITAKADEAVASLGANAETDQTLDTVLSALVNFRTDRETVVPIRRRAKPEEAAPTPDAEKLVSAMLSARLLVSDTDAAGGRTISVAHEALLRRWPRAVAWFDTNQEFLKQRSRVEAACATWEREGRNVAYLIQAGKPLDDALWLLSQPKHALSKGCADFIRTSKQVHEEARRRKRNRVVAGSAAALALTIAAIVGGVIALLANQRATERRTQAEAYFQVHQAERRLSQGDLRSALSLLQDAYSAHPDFTTRSAFLSALTKAPQQLEASFSGFEGAVQQLQFGPDESLAVGAGGSVRVLNTRDLDVSRSLFVPENEESPNILSIARRHDGSWLAQREDGSRIALTEDSATPQLSEGRSFMGPAALSAAGDRLAFVADRQNEVQVGTIDQPWKSISVEPPGAQITALAFKPDESLAVATAAGKVLLISETGEKQTLREATQAKVLCLAWRNRDKPALLAGDEKGAITLLESDATPRVLATVSSRVQNLAWNPDGKSFAAACADGRVRIWSLSEDPDLAASLVEDLPAHQGPALSVAWSPSGSRLASGGNDGVVCLWQPAQCFGPVVTHAIGPPLHSLSVSEDGSRMAAGSQNGDIFIWDVQSKTLSTVSQPGGRILCLAWQPKHQTLASGNESGHLNVWDPSSRQRVASIQSELSSAGDDQTIWRVRWSHDGRKLASSSHNGAVQVWEPEGQSRPQILGKMPDYALGLAWSPDDTMVVAGSTRGEIWLWKAAGASEPVLKIPGGGARGHEDSVSGLAFLPGGNVLASCGRDGTLRLWDVRSGTALARTPTVDAFLDDLAVSVDGSKIATVGTDGYLRVWEKDTLTPTLALALHQRPAAAVVWQDDRIFSASEDGTVRVLNLDEATWKERSHRLIGVDVRQRNADREQKQVH